MNSKEVNLCYWQISDMNMERITEALCKIISTFGIPLGASDRVSITQVLDLEDVVSTLLQYSQRSLCPEVFRDGRRCPGESPKVILPGELETALLSTPGFHS